MTPMRPLMLAAAMLLIAIPAAAQSVRVDHRDAAYPAGFFDQLAPGTPVAGKPGSIWLHDGMGWVQMAVTATPSPGTPTTAILTTPDATTPLLPSDAACQDLNPYTADGAALTLACNARPVPGDETPAFIPGHVYAYGYSGITARVLGIARDLDGVQVITVRWLHQDGGSRLEAIRTPPTPGGQSVWSHLGQEVQ